MEWNSDLWRDVAESVFSRIYPGDERLFDQVWKYLETNPAEAATTKTSRLQGLGIGVDKKNFDPRKIDDIATLVTGFLDAMPFTPMQILERVVAAYRRNGETDERLKLIEVAVKEEIDSLENNPGSRCYTKRLHNKHIDGPKLRSRRYAQGIIKRGEFSDYDFIVDELSAKIAIKGDGIRDIGSLSRVQRGMLWLALSRIGESEKEFVTTEDLFKLIGELGQKDFSTYRNQFGKLLPQIHNRVFKHFDSGQYRIAREEWSFWWIYEKEGKSMLLPC